MNEKIRLESLLKNNPVDIVFDLSYSANELYPACFPVHIAPLKERENIRSHPPKFRYHLFSLSQSKKDEYEYFMWIYCELLRKDISTVPQLEKFFTWMSTIVMDGFLFDAQSTMDLWSSSMTLRYKKPHVQFVPSLRDGYGEHFFEFLTTQGLLIRRATRNTFKVIPV